ncbi:synaptotagmin-1-like isoform X1 [Branchiostoma lanceolatum]|uniref:synaptotagmin-1-like isoform X1 n=1 Tax=Branchiostoma lanceolatum TaxID=7740 RepID=UPI003453FEE0
MVAENDYGKRHLPPLGLSIEAKYSIIAACATFAVVVFIFVVCKWARNWRCGDCCDKNEQDPFDSDIDEKEHGWSSHIVWGQGETSDYESDVNGHSKPRAVSPSFMPYHPQARLDYNQLIEDDLDIPKSLDSGILSIRPVNEQSVPLTSAPTSPEFRAKLRFTLHALDLLFITIHEIKDLPPRMDEAVNTYVKASLSLTDEAKRNNEQYSKDLSRLHRLRWQTSIQKKSLNPVYEERFEAEVHEDEIWKFVFNVEVFEYDKFSRDYSIGVLRFPLRGLRLEDGRTFWQDLKPTKQDSLGEILFTLNYLPTAEKLTIVVIKVKDMVTGKVTSLSKSMFVKVCLVQHYKQVKKKTRLHKIAPEIVLNDSISFDLPHEHLDDVRAILFLCIPQYTSRSGSIRYDVLGQVMVGSGCRGPGQEHWIQMTRSPRRPVARWHLVT